MPVPVRGLHLYPSPWIDPAVDAKFIDDLRIIDTIGNLNSVKTAILSYMDQGSTRVAWLLRQRDKLTAIRQRPSLSGALTFVFRCWPVVPADFPTSANRFDKGRLFAQNLVDPFSHVRYGLQIPNVYMEVANEPSISTEPFGSSIANYNDFFRGFYYGEREIGYDWPLVYSGLGADATATTWYQDYNVQQHIQNYAARIGVHIYGVWGERLNEFTNGVPAGKFYRWVKRTLASAGVTPRGMLATEFAARRETFNGNPTQQMDSQVAWWQEWYADTLAGYWCEQALLYVSNSDSADDITNYKVTDSQLPAIQTA